MSHIEAYILKILGNKYIQYRIKTEKRMKLKIKIFFLYNNWRSQELILSNILTLPIISEYKWRF